MSRRNILEGIPVSARARDFPSPIVSERADVRGLLYAMNYAPHHFGIPTVPMPVRSSVGQPVVRYRLQRSYYISRYRLGLQALIGYPTARGQTIINTAPPQITHPRGNGRAPVRGGVMRRNPRFTKALPLPVNNFNPPVYGQ